MTNSFKPPQSPYGGIWLEFVKAVPLRAGSSRRNPRQLILALKEQRGEPELCSWSGRAGQNPGTAQNQNKCVCSTPSPVQDFHAEAQKDPRHPSAHLRGRGGSQKRELATTQGTPWLWIETGTSPHCFLEFKSTSFWINIFFKKNLFIIFKRYKNNYSHQ